MSRLNEIMEKFKDFTDGYRMILLLNRDLRDGHDYEGFSDKNVITKITTNTDQFREALSELLEIQKTRKDSRIYSCINERNIDKVLFQFKSQQLDMEYLPEIERNKFYFNIQRKFHETFMLSKCTDEMSYLIDVDTKYSVEIRECEKVMSLVSKIILKYETERGWHFIVKQFKPELGQGYKIKYDAFLLLNF